MQTEYTTEQGYNLLLSKVDRRLIDRLVVKRAPPEIPIRMVMTWGDVEEELPILDDPAYQTELIHYHLWLAKEQSVLLASAIMIIGSIDLSELDDFSQIGLSIPSLNAGLLCYILDDNDRAAIIEIIMYQSTVTAQGIAEAELAYNVEWLHKPVTAWRVPSIPAKLSLEYEARSVSRNHGYTWPEFCALDGPDQSAEVCHSRLSNKLAWLEAEYERARKS